MNYVVSLSRQRALSAHHSPTLSSEGPQYPPVALQHRSSVYGLGHAGAGRQTSNSVDRVDWNASAKMKVGRDRFDAGRLWRTARAHEAVFPQRVYELSFGMRLGSHGKKYNESSRRNHARID